MRGRRAARGISVLTPVERERTSEVRAALASLPTGQRSPFHRLDSCHFARFVIIDALPQGYSGAPWPDRPLQMDYVLFTCTCNSAPEDFFAELRCRLGKEADAVWGSCVGYPTSERPEAFVSWFRHNSLRVHLWFAAFDATVPEVRRALSLREKHIRFAVAHQADDAESLHRAFLEEQWG